MRCAAISWCADIPGLQVYIFRRLLPDLIKNHMEGPKGFRAMLAPWVDAGLVTIIEDEIRFWNGSKIFLCHCKDAKDVYKYQGSEIHVLLIDELTHFLESMYRFLRNRVRMVGVELPEEYRGRFPRILCSANPGNIGHLWVKTSFVSPAPPNTIRKMPPEEGGMKRQFIPARLDDNPSMLADDPGYEARLEGLGSKELVAAMRHGNWDVIEGAFFDCWETHKHVLDPFAVPEDWLRFRSADWGSYRPASIGWWAIAGDDHQVDRDGRKVTIPRGALVRYREWYTASSPNVGLKLTAEQLADGIAQREQGDPKLSYGVIDPSAFKEEGGPSVAERVNTALIKQSLIAFRPADNSRIAQRGAMGGWDQMRSRFIGLGGVPMIYCFSTCRDSVRTIPVLQHDQARPEDLDSDGEDHAADDWRYACMSRPWEKERPEPEQPHDAYRAANEEDAYESFKTI